MNKVFQVGDHFLTNSTVTSHIIGYEENDFHSHDFIEFFYVLQGTCEHNYNGVKTQLQVGDAFLLVPCDKHQFVKTPNSNLFLHRDIIFTYDFFKGICNTYQENLYQDIIDKKYKLNFKITNEEITKIESMIPNLIINLSETRYELVTKVITKTIINWIIEKNISLNVTYPNWLIQIINIMNSPYNANFSLNEFLKTIPYSYSYICHKFKDYIGVTMTEYNNQQKIKYAYSLLKTTTLSIEEICNKIGFSNLSHFYNLFKKYYNTTPNKIRK